MDLDPNRWYTLHDVGKLQVLALSRAAIHPTKNDSLPESYLLYSPYDLEVPAGRTKSVSTDLCVSCKKAFLIYVYHSSFLGLIYVYHSSFLG